MSPNPSRSRRSFIERFTPKSVAYEVITWLLFWGLYSLWAGYSPSYPKSNHSEPLFPLVVLGFMLVCFFVFCDRNEIKLLIANSILALLLIPGFLVLNVYRHLTNQFPDSWATAGFLFSQYTFFFIQCGFLVLAMVLVRYTYSRWKLVDAAVKKRYYFTIIVSVAFLLSISVLVIFFVFTGRSRT